MHPKKVIGRWKNWNRVKKFTIQPVGIQEIKEIIENMGNSTAFGIDTLDSNSIKVGGNLLYVPICHIINLSISKRKVPMKWKMAKLISLHKGHGLVKTSPEGYRPIAILPVLSKICEHVLQRQIYRHMMDNKM